MEIHGSIKHRIRPMLGWWVGRRRFVFPIEASRVDFQLRHFLQPFNLNRCSHYHDSCFLASKTFAHHLMINCKLFSIVANKRDFAGEKLKNLISKSIIWRARSHFPIVLNSQTLQVGRTTNIWVIKAAANSFQSKRNAIDFQNTKLYLFFDKVLCFSANSTSFLSTYKPLRSRIESM